ncbi:MAG: DNA double-strand break repair nuclease NurA [Actinomycetota bacterium]
MPELRADPWDPGYGMGFEADVDEASAAVVDEKVETADWSRPINGTAPEGHSVTFIDGVLRVDLRLIAEEGIRRAPGLFGSFAVGCVHCDDTASFGEHVVGRVLVLGGGMKSEGANVEIGRARLDFVGVSVPGSDPASPWARLRQVMRDAEAALARRLAGHPDRLILADGPLMFADPAGVPIVGVVKRIERVYLSPESDPLIGRLGPGERTPLFLIGGAGSGLQRYSWYARPVPRRSHWHSHAGIVRCEVEASAGASAAAAVADRVAGLLPRFAGRPSDPRAPQNLAPIGALEDRLRRRMGNELKIRRALTTRLVRGDREWTNTN